MRIKLENAKIITKDRVKAGSLIIREDKIDSLNNPDTKDPIDQRIDCRGKYILPGFFDTHMHGINLYDCVQGRADPATFERTGEYDDALSHILQFLPCIGVTSAFLCSYAAPKEKMDKFFMEVSKYFEHPGKNHAKLQGIDLEGNFLKDPLFAGAQDVNNFLKPSIAVFEDMQERCSGHIKKALVAPEWGDCAFELIRYLTDKGLFATVGHSGCTKEQLLKAYDCGTRIVVHCGNGPMSQNFKSGGALDGIFELGPALYGEIICDFKHVHPHWVNTFINAFTLEHTLAVADCGYLTGIPAIFRT
jgi:N-acetylglucosamine-6-phosphate deacetylase